MPLKAKVRSLEITVSSVSGSALCRSCPWPLLPGSQAVMCDRRAWPPNTSCSKSSVCTWRLLGTRHACAWEGCVSSPMSSVGNIHACLLACLLLKWCSNILRFKTIWLHLILGPLNPGVAPKLSTWISRFCYLITCQTLPPSMHIFSVSHLLFWTYPPEPKVLFFFFVCMIIL